MSKRDFITDDEGGLDEIVMFEPMMVHLEALGDGDYYLLVDGANGERVMVNLRDAHLIEAITDDGQGGYVWADHLLRDRVPSAPDRLSAKLDELAKSDPRRLLAVTKAYIASRDELQQRLDEIGGLVHSARVGSREDDAALQQIGLTAMGLSAGTVDDRDTRRLMEKTHAMAIHEEAALAEWDSSYVR